MFLTIYGVEKVQIWDQSIKFSMYAKFQLIMFSIGWDTAIWHKKNE